MATLPTDADSSPNYTAANHATHHNTIHGLWNLLTTKGDLFVATAAQAFARLGVGPDGQVLTADSAEASGVKWAAQSGTYVSWTDVTNPLYGAVGDGTTNDAAAITAAIAAAPTGGVLYFPPNKTYKVTTAVAITKSLVVYAPGATIKSTGGTNSLITVTGVDGLTIDGLAFDGNYSTKTLGSGLFVSTSTNVRVLRCKFVNIPEHAVALTNCQRVWVLGNYFSSSGASAVRLMDPGAVTHRRITVARNRVLGGRVGIGMDSLDDSFIVDNVIVGGGVGGEGIAFTGSGNLVRGNNVTGNGTTTAACILLWGVATRTNQRNSIVNNICTNGAQGVAYVYGENATTIRDNTISGNACWGNGWGIQSYSGVGVTTGQTEKNNLITDNDVIGNSSGAINTISASGSPPPAFNNRTSDGEIKILQRFSSPFDGISVLGGVGGAGGVHNGINVRHLDNSSSSAPEIRFEGRFDPTENVKAGGMGTRRTGAGAAGTVETYLYGYTGAAIIEAFKARADGSLEIEGTGLYDGQHLVMGGYHIWLDASGRLRAKSSAPASATDGSALLLAETFAPMTLDPRSLSTAVTLAANQGYYQRVRGAGLITKIGVDIGTSSGNVCVAVYSNNGSNGKAARPTTRVATSGSVASPGTGYQEIALTGSIYVNDGDWFYLGADNATVTFFRAGTNGAGGAMGDGLSHFQASAFPAPTPTATPVAGNSWHSFLLIGVT